MTETPVDHVDSFLDMMLRRQINDFAEEKVDFNLEGLRLAQEHLGGLGSGDVVLDLGCSSGKFATGAAEATGTSARQVGMDLHAESYRDFLLPRVDTRRFSFVQAVGEAIPLADNAVRVTTAHNVLFRTDVFKTLAEMQRVTEPGGLIVVSTNARKHAVRRHDFERHIAELVGQEFGLPAKPLEAPAHGCYVEDLPGIVAAVGELTIIDKLIQDSEARITRGDRLDDYLYSLKLSANRLGDDPRIRSVWRKCVDAVVVPVIEEHIARHEAANKRHGIDEEPYFPDTVHRGLFVLRNVKAKSRS